MPQAWAAEIVVSDALARALIESQFPHLAPARVQLLGVGWDNTAFRVNDTTVFRFPRRQVAVALFETEIRLMPAIAPRLPLPVPTPTFVGRPTDLYPWPFAGYPMLPGRTACTVDLDDRQRAVAAEPLARFLAALHAVPTAEAARHGAGRDTIARLDLDRRLSKARNDLRQIARQGLLADVRPFLTLLAAAPATYTARTDTLVHGDLYARHLLVDPGHRLAGVIDWGDVHLGDPAVDLAIAHTFLAPAARPVFLAAYGPIADVTWHIAGLRALWHTLTVVAYAVETGDADLVREGQRALQHLGSP